MKPIIYICGEDAADPYTNYRAALTAAGAVPVTPSDGVSPDACQGLLLPGGGDIDNALPPEETALIRSFAESGRPILGICRGMQALNVYFGGTLYADVPGHRTPGCDMVHPTAAEGPVAALLGPAPTVNSSHHQAVERLGDGLVICQRAADGTVEAFVHRSLPILGVQWHPERQSFARLRPDAVDAAPVFRRFLCLAGASRP